MKRLLPYALTFCAALAAAVLLWALREKLPGPLPDVLSPVHRGVWEVGKAAFFPLLAAAPLLWRLQGGGSRGGLCLMAVCGAAAAMLLALLSVPPAAAAAAAWGIGLTLYALVLRRIGGDALPWYALTAALTVAYILLTILPPHGGIFAAQAAVTGGSIPF